MNVQRYYINRLLMQTGLSLRLSCCVRRCSFYKALEEIHGNLCIVAPILPTLFYTMWSMLLGRNSPSFPGRGFSRGHVPTVSNISRTLPCWWRHRMIAPIRHSWDHQSAHSEATSQRELVYLEVQAAVSAGITSKQVPIPAPKCSGDN